MSGTQAFAIYCPSEFFSWLSEVLLAVLVLLWLGVSAFTIKHGLSGRLFNSPCMKDLPLEQEVAACELPPDNFVRNCSPV